MLSGLYQMIRDMAILAKSPLSRVQKFAVLRAYWKLWVTRPSTSASILGFTVHTYSFANVWYLFREIFVHNEYFFRASSATPVIIDAGANIGMATLYFSWLYPQATIHAFEADPTTITMLRKNVESNNLRNVQVHHAAVAAEDGTMTFYTDPHAAGSLKTSTVEGRVAYEGVAVPAVNLADFVQERGTNVSLLKMDIEGGEVAAIGALTRDNMLRHIDQAIIEYHHQIHGQPAALAPFLAQWEVAGFGYRLHTQAMPLAQQGKFQDVLFYFYKRSHS